MGHKAAGGGRLDILAANQLGYALYSEVFASSTRPANTVRFVFLDPRAVDFYRDWEHVTSDVVAILRSEAGRNPYDPDLSALVRDSRLRASCSGDARPGRNGPRAGLS